MWTLKFKIQPTVTLFTAINHCSGPLRKQKCFARRGQRVISCAVIGRFQSTLSVSVFLRSVGCCRNYDWQFRVCMSLKVAVNHITSSKTGVVPPHRDAHQFVMQQRHEHFNDLKHTLKVMRKISDDDEVPFKLSMMFLLDEGALRFVKIPKVSQFTCTSILFITLKAILILIQAVCRMFVP